MKIYKPKFWETKNLLCFILLPFSFLLRMCSWIINLFVKKEKFDIPIICVGNIYLGGTGKTPLSIEIASILKKEGKKPVIIKKFYREHYDEHELIKNKNIDLITSASRKKGIADAISNNFNVVILDDGFQDNSVYKNLNILCFNENQLAGNEMTIPSGPLREPLSSLRKSQIVLINGNSNKDFESKIKNISEKINIYYSNYLLQNLDDFKNKNLLAFAGIGNPDNFFNLLEKNKLKIQKKIPFPDHYKYSIKELNNLINYAEKNNLEIITTEKDYFRIKHYGIHKIKFLSIKLEFDNKEKLFKEIKNYL